MIHTDTDYAITGYDNNLKAVYLKYKRKGTSVEFREANLQLLKSIMKTSSHRLYVDARNMGVVAPEDQKWVANQVVPQLASFAPKKFLYIASVLSEHVFTKMAVDTVVELSNSLGVCQNKQFSSEVEAKSWLLQRGL